MEEVYNERVVLHIPRYSFESGRLTELPEGVRARFDSAMAEEMSSSGVIGSYGISATGYYKGRTYGETLLSIYCTDTQEADGTIAAFKRAIEKNKDSLKQESYAYERGDKLIVFTI